MKVCIGLSIYELDHEQWCLQAIDSVLNQTFTDYYFGIYIDGPIDPRFSELIRALVGQDPRVSVFKMEKRRGLAAGINYLLGWAASLGADYFFRMDSDDICHPSRLQVQLDFMSERPDVGLCGTAIREFTGESDFSETPQQVREVPESHVDIVKGLARYSTFNHPTVCFRISAIMPMLQEGELYRTDCGLAEDYRLWVDLALMEVRFANLKEPLLAFRVTEDFYRRRSVGRAFSEWRVRLYAMKSTGQFTLINLFFSIGVLGLRLMPIQVLKFAYKWQRGMS